ncbi:solute carrier family 35 member E3 [Salpingoeca rosetta]|uniref:Solute carrier family 35 member E3 n=1 Tax=Salpingoeca rosetta (strain ATCC 50818 / BSB-021) TaxID=946362 RepID=F2UIL3_SALR5|nr:solute carrier family 35 member E3 [Salpingoeca rosetta]EGD77062.1 solute carrier family 35 member E3 [Salpingoeca rosetta]|eukprot:XP_004990902.1 solute carrier family 35 member E3 [Salpingoeca rosetta]
MAAANCLQPTQLFMLLNYTSSIMIVFLNKMAYTYGFPSITLTMIHFLMTFAGLKVCSMMGIFQVKRLRIMDVLPLSLAFCGFVVFTNLSLLYNTVGFYQLAKVMTTPAIVLVHWVFYKQSYSKPILLSLLLVCIGVAQATQADVTTNSKGLFFATCGVLVTSIYQIWVKTKQQDLEVSAFQLLFYQAPLSAGLLAVIIPFVEPPFEPYGVLAQEWSAPALLAVLGSSIMAFLVNLSIFLVIGKTSPITYNVLGHFKLCTVLAGGFIIFHDPLNASQSMGILLTLFGIFAYTHFKLKESGAVLPTASKQGSGSSA